ncbi:MAG TPA: hydrogen gas-evolving membrane-bound hydrogenase subunit E, partial [Deinococcales bacterium]|nr:hydrogen gas-evolving membrane-bound hydrogenase subunit E [Deinococcales bacterium]
LVLRAPDLALTQLLIESTTIILFLLVIRSLPSGRSVRRSGGARVVDAVLASAFGLGLFTFLAAAARPLGERISGYYLENSYKAAGGKNVVNVILVDFRGYDTMGEITVLAIVAVGVYALVRLRGAP